AAGGGHAAQARKRAAAHRGLLEGAPGRGREARATRPDRRLRGPPRAAGGADPPHQPPRGPPGGRLPPRAGLSPATSEGTDAPQPRLSGAAGAGLAYCRHAAPVLFWTCAAPGPRVYDVVTAEPATLATPASRAPRGPARGGAAGEASSVAPRPPPASASRGSISRCSSPAPSWGACLPPARA